MIEEKQCDQYGSILDSSPVTRTLVVAMFVESLLVYGGMMSFQRIFFHHSLILKIPPEPWRVLSSFLLTGGGISFIFDLFFAWTYSSGLELNSPRFAQPGDYFTYVLFVASVILLLAGFLLQAYIFTSALLLAFMYTFAQDNPGKKAHFIIFQIPVEFLPWAMLCMTFVLAGPNATLQQGTGLVAAHLYDFLTRLYPKFQGGRNFIQTPAVIKRRFGADRPSFTNKGYGTGYRPGQPVPKQQSSGWTSAFSPNQWGGRGSGRRLGGD